MPSDRDFCRLNPHCNQQKNKSKLVCSRCWDLLPRAWRQAIPKMQHNGYKGERREWEDRIERFFRLTEFPMPKVPCWPSPDVDNYDLARFEIKLMEYLHPEFDKSGDFTDTIKRVEELREQVLDKFRMEAAEKVRDELRSL